jgi:hypothetical protein
LLGPLLFSLILAPTPAPAPTIAATVGTRVRLRPHLAPIPQAAYRFEIDDAHSAPVIIRDFATHSDVLDWTPLDEGVYRATIVTRSTRGTSSEAATIVVGSRLHGAPAMASLSSHPLIALVSFAPCGAGSKAQIEYSAPNEPTQSQTIACFADRSENVMIAGLLPRTTYTFRIQTTDPYLSARLTPLQVTTGALPPLPAVTVAQGAPDPGIASSVVLYSIVNNGPTHTGYGFAVDMQGRVVWFYDQRQGSLGVMLRPAGDGRFFIVPTELEGGVRYQLFREVNLLGETVRETTTTDVNAQLAQADGDPIVSFHHDALALPDGSFALLAATERPLRDPATGELVDFLGDEIVVLDSHLRLRWSWNLFDHLNPFNYPATLQDSCMNNIWNCEPAHYKGRFVDWSHANALYYNDGRLLLSLRDIDQIIAFDYDPVHGVREPLFNAGRRGNITLTSTDPHPWFSHQHGPALSGDYLATFDNSNFRKSGDVEADSRGQVYLLSGDSASLILDYDLGGYSNAFGDAQFIGSCKFAFEAGPATGSSASNLYFVDDADKPSLEYEQTAAGAAYRALVLPDLLSLPMNDATNDDRCWRDDRLGVHPSERTLDDVGQASAPIVWQPRADVADNGVKAVDGGFPVAVTYGSPNNWISTTQSLAYGPRPTIQLTTTAPSGTRWYFAIDCEGGRHYEAAATQNGAGVSFTFSDLQQKRLCRDTEIGFSIPPTAAPQGKVEITGLSSF